MSLSRSLSPTNTHTNASSCPRQWHEHPSYRGDRDTNLHVITHLFVPFHLRAPFLSLLIFAIRSHPLSLMLAQGHAYILSILILVWGRMSFHPHVCTCTAVAMFFMPCINVSLVHIEPFSTVKPRSTGREGHSHFHLAAPSVQALSYS
jgi:hypothetical protein